MFLIKLFKIFLYDIYVDIFLVLILFFYALHNLKLNSLSMIGILLFIISMGFWVLARIQLGKAFSVDPKAIILVTSGLYSKIRHPIYFFSFLTILGILIIIQEMNWFLILIINFILQLVRIKAENKTLKEKFGKNYENYIKNAWF